MNGKQLACVMLMLIIGVVTYSAQMVHKKTAAAKADALAAQDASQIADNERQLAETRAKALEFDSSELRRFLGAWTPPIQRMQTSQEIEESIQASIRAASLFVDSQRFEPKNTGIKTIPRVIKAAIVAEDEYAKTMNWLGELEKKVPLARITICRVTAGKEAKSIRLELSIEVPIINLTADPTEVVKKA